MPDTWEYREPQGRPQHPPTERVPWQPSRYNPAEHLGRLQPWLPDEPSAAGPQPAFTPAAPPQAPRAPGPWGAAPDDPWQASTGQPPAPSYRPPQGYRPPLQPQPARYAPPMQPAQRPRGRSQHAIRNIFAGIGGLITLIIVVSAVSNSGHGTTSTLSSGPGAQAPAAQGAPASTGQHGTTSELQALVAAQSYLGDGQGFSRQGLIDQLDSPAGDNFSVADATWAVNHSGANWDDQAVDCAKGYMSDGQGFSRQGLIDQMTSAYGNKFTQAQATHAANAVGL